MSRKEKIFLILAVLYFIGCLTGASLVTDAIRVYIGKHGWSTFNSLFFPFLYLVLIIVLALVVSRLWIRYPTWGEIVTVGMGIAVSTWIVSNTMLLTTELVHIPQFLFSTLLFMAAFPRNLPLALTFGGVVCIADEWAQTFMPGRVLDLNDIALNFIGWFLALVAWQSWHGKPTEEETVTGH
ncbi:MAG: VanZ family protein [Candidatus Omnitrophica bacterium]|nr:VanZ family protein [Candidatus Omnitrophota bacterium]